MIGLAAASLAARDARARAAAITYNHNVIHTHKDILTP